MGKERFLRRSLANAESVASTETQQQKLLTHLSRLPNKGFKPLVRLVVES